MKEPGQNCKYVNDLVNEFKKYVPEEDWPELENMANIIKDRFTLMREWGKKQQSSKVDVNNIGFFEEAANNIILKIEEAKSKGEKFIYIDYDTSRRITNHLIDKGFEFAHTKVEDKWYLTVYCK